MLVSYDSLNDLMVNCYKYKQQIDISRLLWQRGSKTLKNVHLFNPFNSNTKKMATYLEVKYESSIFVNTLKSNHLSKIMKIFWSLRGNFFFVSKLVQFSLLFWFDKWQFFEE